MTYGLGLKPSTPARVVHRLGALKHPRIAARFGLGSSPLGKTLLAPPALDQGQSGTCHAHSMAMAVAITLQNTGKPLAWMPSPLLIASCAYADMQRSALGAGQALPVLQDTGAELQDDADAVRSWGIGPMGDTIAGRSGDSDVPDDPPDNSFPEPGAATVGAPVDLTRLQVSGATLVSGEYGIPIDANAPATVAAAIDAGIAVRTGFFVDTAFQELQAGDIAQPPDPNDPNGGGHSTLLYGYRVNGAHQFEFLMRNSWGLWCTGGDCWCSEAWLMACWDLHPEACGT